MTMVAAREDIRITGDCAEPEPEQSQSSKPIIGIIYPPPEVRNIVDKTASFVCRNGPHFEEKIRQNELNNAKFNFLYDTDPYHAYYRHKLREFLEGKGTEPSVSQNAAVPAKPAVAVALEKLVLKDPPPPYEFITEPPTISALDLDVVRLTALYVSRNGRSFLTQLMLREKKNAQFDFLRPQHSLFQYFTKLVEQYTKVLNPPKSLIEKLNKEISNPKSTLDAVRYRVEWARHEERLKQKELQAIEKERLMYAQIDWHDFVVVETVDFFAEEQGNFPRPVQVEELGARLIHQERIEKYGQEVVEEHSDEEVAPVRKDARADSSGIIVTNIAPPVEQTSNQPEDMDMGESSDEEGSNEKMLMPHPKMAPKIGKEVIIRKDYNPKSKLQKPAPLGDNMIISPLTQQPIPASRMNEHMRYGLLDPAWKEQQQRQLAEKQAENEDIASGSNISSALHNLASRRTDIFGVEETAIGKKVGEEETSKESTSWDGHSSSMRETQRQANEKVTIEEQIHHTKKTLGLLIDEKLERIGPKYDLTGSVDSKDLTSKSDQSNKITSNVSTIPVQQLRQTAVLTPVVMRPAMIRVQQPNPQPVLVVQQQVPVVRQPQAQLIAVQRQPVMMSHPMVQTQMVQPMQQMSQMQHQMMSEGPASKRSRAEADLIPADIFLQQNGGPIMIRVQCPNLPEKTEWKLQGQMLTFSLPLTDEVSVIKAKIHESTGMPAGKQKLQLEGLFIKDSNSLAHYNMVNGALVVLQVKERGGRRK